MVECPSRSMTTRAGMCCDVKTVALEWRRSWKRILGSPMRVTACLERDNSPSALYLSQNPVLTDRAMTPNEFKQLAEAVANF
jgi:hypothetical protein